MYKGNIIASTIVTQNDTIPFGTVRNTTRDISILESGEIRFHRPGTYMIQGMVTVTNASDDFSLILVADGMDIKDSVAAMPVSATSDVVTLPIIDSLLVVPSGAEFNIATLVVQATASGTIVSGNISIYRI